MSKSAHSLLKYFRPGSLPSTHCPGCGNGIISNALLTAIDKLQLDFNKCVFVAGIGCSGYIASYLYNTDVIHTTHGRALAFATGIKASNPELKVIAIVGDGDCGSIGGNHLLHAARRNIGITTICVNNGIYGMTGGQVSPTTPVGFKTATSPYGNIENPIDLVNVAVSAGASYVARWSTFHFPKLVTSLEKALSRHGFNFVEVLSQCPVQLGRRNKMADPYEALEWVRSRTFDISRNQGKPVPEDKIQIGEFAEREREEYTTAVYKLIRGRTENAES